MRILHTSDWHLGIALHGVPLLEDQREMVARLIETVRAEKIDAVVAAGDLFDHAVARPETIGLYNDAMVALCRDCRVPVLVIAGNHDGAARLASCSVLLREAGLYVSGRLTDPVEPVVIGSAAFFLLPYFNTEEARYLYPPEQIRGYSDAMAAVTKRMRDRFLPGRCNILAAHCFACGAEVSESDRAAAVGGASQVDPSVFEGFDYVALGHLHRAQQFGAARYSGSPLAYSFSEAGQEKSFTIFDTDDGSVREIPVAPRRMLRVLSGEFDRVYEAAQLDERREDYLKIELTDCYAGLEKLELFREIYPNLLLLTGRAAQMEENAGSLTVEELSHMGPRELVTRFCTEVAGEAPDEEQLAWFDEAARETEGEVAQ